MIREEVSKRDQLTPITQKNKFQVNGTRINNSTAEAHKTRINNNSITEVPQVKTSNSTIEVLRIKISMRREILASWEAL